MDRENSKDQTFEAPAAIDISSKPLSPTFVRPDLCQHSALADVDLSSRNVVW